MDVNSARTLVRLFARNAQDPDMYTNLQIDTSIQTVCDDFIRRTRCTKRTDAITLTASDSDLPAFPTHFLPDALLAAYLTGDNVTVTPGDSGYAGAFGSGRYYTEGTPAYDGIPTSATLRIIPYPQLNDLSHATAMTGQPQFVGFSSTTAGAVYPTPDQDYTLNFLWVEPLTAWTAGSGTNPTLNIPDRFLQMVLTLGVPAWMQQNEPENGYARGQLERYERYVASVMNAGSLGAKEVLSIRGVR